MKYRYIGDTMITVKSPCPQTGQRVDLMQGDTVELEWLPGGTKQVLIPVVEEVAAPAPVEVKEVPKTKTKLLKKKKKG